VSLEELAAKAVSEYASMVTQEARIKERGIRRRRRRLAGGAVAVAAAGTLALVSGVFPDLGGGQKVNTVAAPATPSPGAGTQSPSPRVGDVQKALGARLVETSECPAVAGVSWTISLGSEPLSTTPILAVSRLPKGSEMAKAYGSGQASKGWLSMSRPAGVRMDEAGNLTLLEGTPGLRVDDPAQLKRLSVAGFGCRAERWERSHAGADADLDVMWGKSALLYLLRMRSQGSMMGKASQAGGAGIPVYHIASASEEALVFDLRPNTVLAVRTAPGSMPPLSTLRAWLLP